MKIRYARLAICSMLLCLLGPPGCGAVGPTARQGVDGQEVGNTPNNVVTLTDPAGTTTASVAGPTDWTHSTSGDTVSHTTGMVTRTVLFKDGTGKEVAVRSGSDITAKGVKFDPITGAFSIGEFATSSSAPLTALGELQAKFQDTVKLIASEQRLSYADAYATVSKSIESLQPSLAQLIKGAFGIP